MASEASPEVSPSREASPDSPETGVVTPVEQNVSSDGAGMENGPVQLPPDSIARHKVEKWLHDAVAALDKLGEMPERVGQLRALLENASKEIQAPETEIEELTPDEETVAASESSESEARSESEQFTLVPELRYVPWQFAAHSAEAGVLYQGDGLYHTIDIPLQEPVASDFQFMFTHNWEPAKDQMQEKGDVALPRHDNHPTYLPERIRINSRKFRSFLDQEFGNKSLKYEHNTCFSILRPFQMLLYVHEKLRTRVGEMTIALEKLEDAPAPDEVLVDADTAGPWQWEGAAENPDSLARCIRDCRCLLQFVDTVLIPEQTRLAAGPEEVRFVDLYFLYPQGSLVYVKDNKVPHKIWKVVQAIGGRRYLDQPDDAAGDYRPSYSLLLLDCFFLDYDGERFVPVYRTFEVAEFAGLQSVKVLPIIPFIVAEKDPSLINRQALLARGRQFVACTKGVSHLEFSGRSHYLSPNGTKLISLVDPPGRSALYYSERIDSEVMIDFGRALQAVPGWRPEAAETVLHESNKAETGQSCVDNDAQWDRKMSDEFIDDERRKMREWEFGDAEPSEDDDLLLLPDRVFGFVLSSRQWACLKIGRGADGEEQLRERTRKEHPWEKLQLPRGHKEMVQSLITSHFSRTQSQQVHFDLLKNKGNGVIILLHGVPGVGKTSTAECVAISNDKPLLPITCGDLGLTPRDVEDKLKEVFRLAQDWGCVMLLDEADVFLAQRSVTDTNRNALVSVFLRTLEYYEGILFLTTNRVGVFDEAFKSRIHMALYYPPLTSSQTVRIWQRHIEQASQAGIHVDTDDLLDFADKIYQIQNKGESSSVWNGRQIRNAFQSAVALAAFNANGGTIRLDRKYFEDVFTVSDQFSAYVWTTKNYQTDADRNRLAMTRRDNFEYHAVGTGEVTLQSQLQQQKQQSAYLSTFGQDIPRSVGNIGLQMPQGGSVPGAAGYPTHPQRFDNVPSTAMRHGNNIPPEAGVQNLVNPNNAHMLQGQQPSQYPTQPTTFGTGQPGNPLMDQSMFGSPYGSSGNVHHG